MSRSERIYYLVYGLYNASWSFLTPVYTLFLLQRGLDLFEINLVFAVYLITAFLFEVPTGAVADVMGRKISFLLSCVLRTLAFSLYWTASSFSGFLVAEVFDAVGTTLATGSLDAWAVDRLHEEGHSGSVERLFTRAFLLCRPLMITAGVLGGYAGSQDIGTPWLLGASSFAVTGLVGLVLMRETKKTRTTHRGILRTWASTTMVGFATVRSSGPLALLTILTAATAFAVMPAWHYWPARLSELSGTGTWLMGWVWAIINVTAMMATALMPRLVVHYRRERILAVAWVIRGSLLLLAALATSFAPALFGIVIMDAIYGLSEPVLQAWTNEKVDSEHRATVMSVRSMAFTLGGGVGLILLGLLGRHSGIPTTWGVSAILLMMIAPAFLLLGTPTSTPRDHPVVDAFGIPRDLPSEAR